MRVIGTQVETDVLADAMKPNLSYRVDKKGEGRASLDCVYFDVAEAETAGELVEGIVSFLARHEAALSKLPLDSDTTEINLDIGLIIDENQLSISIDLGRHLIALADKLRMSVTVGTMRSSPESNC